MHLARCALVGGLAAAAGLVLGGSAPRETVRAAAAAEPAGPEALQVATGSVEGRITLGGTSLPSPTRVQNSTDPDVCGTEHDLEDLVVAPESRGVRHVIVSLAGVPEELVADRPPERHVIDNRDCSFVPHATVAVVGDTIVAVNHDATLHNTHYYGPLASNVALSREGMSVARVARRPGLVTVLCDVHGWMRAYLRIDPHPFHAVSDAAGRFRIDGIPPGSYTLELWHERLGERSVEVRIEPGGVATVDVGYPPVE